MALNFESKYQTRILPWNMTDIVKIYKQKKETNAYADFDLMFLEISSVLD